MRILSQDGMIDLPYEKVGLTISCYGRTDGVDGDDKHYRIRAIGLDDKRIDFMAHYSTKSKARKSMEMLRTAYQGNKIEETYREGTNYYHSIFQFPADDEVEEQDV